MTFDWATTRCLEQIRNDVCYHDVNVKIVSVGGGLAYGPGTVPRFADRLRGCELLEKAPWSGA